MLLLPLNFYTQKDCIIDSALWEKTILYMYTIIHLYRNYVGHIIIHHVHEGLGVFPVP
jgi:hypothetical protein